MLKEDCRRWMTLTDRQACNEALSPADVLFRQKHVKKCATCAQEQRLWMTLEGVLDDPSLLEQPLPTSREPSLGRNRSFWRPRATVLGATVLGAAAGLCLVYALVAQQTSRQSHAHTPLALNSAGEPTPQWQLLSVSGVVSLGSSEVRAGDTWNAAYPLRTADGQVCVSLEDAVTVCLDANSELSVDSLTPSLRALRLHRGRVASRLSKQPVGRHYEVRVLEHAVLAKGTEFVVALEDPSVFNVHLYEGTVEVGQARGGQERGEQTRLVAPAAAAFSPNALPKALDEQARASDAALRAAVARKPSAPTVVLEVLTHPDHATLSIDDQVVGTTPLSLLVHEGRRLSLTKPGHASVTELLTIDGQRNIRRTYELNELPLPAASASTPRAVEERVASVSPKDLMLRAQSLRAAGKQRESIGLLRQLVQKYPSSAEARVSLLTLGELELSVLNQPAAALGSFEAYLKTPGPLAREAQYGKIRALVALSRLKEAAAAKAAFIETYPNSVQASKWQASGALK